MDLSLCIFDFSDLMVPCQLVEISHIAVRILAYAHTRTLVPSRSLQEGGIFVSFIGQIQGSIWGIKEGIQSILDLNFNIS